jgi:hypothetical protein
MSVNISAVFTFNTIQNYLPLPNYNIIENAPPDREAVVVYFFIFCFCSLCAFNHVQ